MRVIVVGAGVIGLTCAVRLLESGHRVDVLARDLPGETTSAVAAALWHAYLAQPEDKVAAWSAAAYDVFEQMSREERTGVRMLSGTEVLRQPRGEPAGERRERHSVAPIVDMPVYLRWLVERVEALGGTLTRMNLSELPVGGPDLSVVDCSGIGARLLAADLSVTPVRGQVVVVEQFGLDRWWLDESGPTYVVPRLEEVVVGGTEVAGEWSRTPDPEVAADILRRASELVPELARARVVRHRVGLRPVRPEVRLERVGEVVHCYGHGGSGVTVSWGCADDVVALVG